jgi:hypothetical protein
MMRPLDYMVDAMAIFSIASLCISLCSLCPLWLVPLHSYRRGLLEFFAAVGHLGLQTRQDR